MGKTKKKTVDLMARMRRPQDATMRNVRAAAGRHSSLSRRVTKLEHTVALLAASVAALAYVMGESKL